MIVPPFLQLALVPAHKPNPQGPGTHYSQCSTAEQLFKYVQGSECWAVLISLLLYAQEQDFYCQIRWMLFPKALALCLQ